MWVTKLLISLVKKRIFCPKTAKFSLKLAFLSIAGSFGALTKGWLVVVARAVSRKTPIYFILILEIACKKGYFECAWNRQSFDATYPNFQKEIATRAFFWKIECNKGNCNLRKFLAGCSWSFAISSCFTPHQVGDRFSSRFKEDWVFHLLRQKRSVPQERKSCIRRCHLADRSSN